MSFGFGPASEMYKKVKNSQRERYSTLKKINELGSTDSKEGSVLVQKNASPAQLKEIRKKLQKENRRNSFIKLIFFTVFLFLIIYFVGFYAN